jgi:hypothetical protein
MTTDAPAPPVPSVRHVETVPVTAEHIGNGIANDCELCPVALALLALWPGADIHVGRAEMWLWPATGGSLTAVTPPSVRQFIDVIDSGGRKSAEPFDFTVEWTAGNYDQEPAS